MKNNLIRAMLLCCLVLFFGICFGQSPTDSLQSKGANAAIATFNKATGEQSWLYNGADYDLGARLIKGNPNYQDTTVTLIGSLVYYGFTYTNVPLLYNINKDMLVSILYDGYSKYSFISDKVSEFNLLDTHFIRLAPDSISKKVVKPGFYASLYNNKLQVLVKYTKIIHIVSPLMGPDDYYEPKTFYYLKKAGRYYQIDGESDMMAVLQDHKKELKKYIKDNKLKFKNGPEQSMVMLATYYDHLTN
ncbi:MAG: hypothetical protein V4592_06590 [Bacteroidota bacterium]